MSNFSFKGLATKLVNAAKAFKADVLKVAAQAPTIVQDVEKDAPEVEAIVNLAFPGSAAVEQVALDVLEAVADAVEAAGSAASENGLSVSLDQTLIAKVKSAADALKNAAGKL
jgi:hypothetical protein